jgi:hypothetical protein
MRFDGAGSELCSRINFEISGVEPSGSAAGELISF